MRRPYTRCVYNNRLAPCDEFVSARCYAQHGPYRRGTINTLDVLYAQLTRDLFAIAKFLLTLI